MSDFLGKSPDKGVGVKNANIVTGRKTAKRVAFLLKFDVTKDFYGFLWLLACCNGFMVLGMRSLAFCPCLFRLPNVVLLDT